MRIILQRCSEASVSIDKEIVGEIDRGLLIFLGIEENDTEKDVDWLVHKLVKLRIFSDENGKMNKSVQDIDGELLLVSQFTLHAKVKKGTRPSFVRAAHPDKAIPLYELFIDKAKALGLKVKTGKFGAMMHVHLVNDGPVTIWIDSKNRE